LLFLIVRLFGVVRAWHHTVAIRRSTSSAEAPHIVQTVWRRCLDAFALKDVDLLWSADISSPVTVGMRRPAVILPEALRDSTSEDVLTTAIGHELAHVARRDFALGLFSELIHAPVSFHPAAWLIRKGVDRSREMACDELVTEKLVEPQVYAQSIVKIAQKMSGLRQPGYSLGVFDADILEERIRRLTARVEPNMRRARLLFAVGLSALASCVLIASSLAVSARAQSGTQTELKLGIAASNQADFRRAITHFEAAVRQEPTAVSPKLYLAHALLSDYHRGQRREAAPLESARQQYLDALAYDPRNKPAMQGMIAIGMETRQLRQAREWAERLIQSDSNDKTGYYSAGVLDWAMVFPDFQKAKMAAGGRVEDYAIADPIVRQRMRDQHFATVERGIKMEQAAVALDANYADAMAYLNLLLRLKAGLVDNPAEAASLIASADAWVGRALAAKKEQPTDPARLDINGPPPGPPMPPSPPPPPRPKGA
jgi:tetratricopeptide (TPR) repeat protein